MITLCGSTTPRMATGASTGAERVERRGAVAGLVVLVYSRPCKSALAPTIGGPAA